MIPTIAGSVTKAQGSELRALRGVVVVVVRPGIREGHGYTVRHVIC